MNNYSKGFSLSLENPGEFLHSLYRLGALAGFGIESFELEPCGAKLQEGQGYRQYDYECQEAKGHYPATKHDDWERKTWVDPVPEPEPVPEPLTEAGGQFS